MLLLNQVIDLVMSVMSLSFDFSTCAVVMWHFSINHYLVIITWGNSGCCLAKLYVVLFYVKGLHTQIVAI